MAAGSDNRARLVDVELDDSIGDDAAAAEKQKKQLPESGPTKKG